MTAASTVLWTSCEASGLPTYLGLAWCPQCGAPIPFSPFVAAHDRLDLVRMAHPLRGSL